MARSPHRQMTPPRTQRVRRSGKGRRSGCSIKAIAAAYALTSAASALSAAPVRRTPTKASTGRVGGHSPAHLTATHRPSPTTKANTDEVPAAVSRRSHLTTSVTAPVAAAVGAKGLVAVAQDLAARRAAKSWATATRPLAPTAAATGAVTEVVKWERRLTAAGTSSVFAFVVGEGR